LGYKINHDEAIRIQAAERYVSHELSAAEQKDFEEHFFDCSACADEVRLELTFAANMRAVSRELRAEPQPSPKPPKAKPLERWWKWLRLHPVPAFSLAGNLALAAVLGYILLSARHAVVAPRLIASYFAPGPTHGAGDIHDLARGETIYQVRFLISGPQSPSYFYEILDAAAKRESSGSLPSPPGDDDSLNLQIPVASLPSGVHTLMVRAGSGGEMVSWSKFRTSR
jgi:hypothetical protein